MPSSRLLVHHPKPTLPPALVIRVLTFAFTALEAQIKIRLLDLHLLFKRKRGPLKPNEFMEHFTSDQKVVAGGFGVRQLIYHIEILQNQQVGTPLKQLVFEYRAPSIHSFEKIKWRLPRWTALPGATTGAVVEKLTLPPSMLFCSPEQIRTVLLSIPNLDRIRELALEGQGEGRAKDLLRVLAQKLPGLHRFSGPLTLLPEAEELFVGKKSVSPSKMTKTQGKVTILFNRSSKELTGFSFHDVSLECLSQIFESKTWPRIKEITLGSIASGQSKSSGSAKFSEFLIGLVKHFGLLEKLEVHSPAPKLRNLRPFVEAIQESKSLKHLVLPPCADHQLHCTEALRLLLLNCSLEYLDFTSIAEQVRSDQIQQIIEELSKAGRSYEHISGHRQVFLLTKPFLGSLQKPNRWSRPRVSLQDQKPIPLERVLKQQCQFVKISDHLI